MRVKVPIRVKVMLSIKFGVKITVKIRVRVDHGQVKYEDGNQTERPE